MSLNVKRTDVFLIDTYMHDYYICVRKALFQKWLKWKLGIPGILLHKSTFKITDSFVYRQPYLHLSCSCKEGMLHSCSVLWIVPEKGINAYSNYTECPLLWIVPENNITGISLFLTAPTTIIQYENKFYKISTHYFYKI